MHRSPHAITTSHTSENTFKAWCQELDLDLDEYCYLVVISSSTIESVAIKPGLWGEAHKDISQRAALLKIIHIKLNNRILKDKHIISIAVPQVEP